MPTFNANMFGAAVAAIFAFAIRATGTYIDASTRPTGEHPELMFVSGFVAIPIGAGMGACGLLVTRRSPLILGLLGLAGLAFACGLLCVACRAPLMFTGWMWLLSSLLGASGAALFIGGAFQSDALALAANYTDGRKEAFLALSEPRVGEADRAKSAKTITGRSGVTRPPLLQNEK